MELLLQRYVYVTNSSALARYLTLEFSVHGTEVVIVVSPPLLPLLAEPGLLLPDPERKEVSSNNRKRESLTSSLLSRFLSYIILQYLSR